jgi:hypothetical protein
VIVAAKEPRDHYTYAACPRQVRHEPPRLNSPFRSKNLLDKSAKPMYNGLVTEQAEGTCVEQCGASRSKNSVWGTASLHRLLGAGTEVARERC